MGDGTFLSRRRDRSSGCAALVSSLACPSNGECIGQTGSGDCGNPAPTYWNVNALPVDQGNYQNFTFTIH
jgi:hypothetical protein